MKALMTVIVVIMLGVAPILMMNAVEASRTEKSTVGLAYSSDYIAHLEWAFQRQRKEIQQLRIENAALTAELAHLKSVTTNAPATSR